MISLLKKILPIFFMLFCYNIYAASPADEFFKQKNDEILGINKSYHDGDLIPLKCGTPVAVALQAYKMKFPDEPIDEVLTRPTNLPDTFGSEHILVHYTTAGQDAPYQVWVDIDPPDGIPDYINRVQEIFEYVWIFETGDEQLGYLGYNTPPIDSGMGGDNRYDIYVLDLGTGYYGFAVPEGVAGQYQIPSFIELENDFSGTPYQSDPIDGIKVTAAHNIFHAIQFGYDAFEFDYEDINDPSTYKPWWFEASATWIEEVVYDDINDYYNYLPFFFNYPWMSLGTFSYTMGPRAYHPYASCVWPLYLSEKYEIGIVREIWESCGAVEGYNTLTATNDVLQFRNSSLYNDFQEFSVWNYHTGSYADTASFYSEGDHYPNVDSTLFIHLLTDDTVYINNIQLTPEHLAANYIVIQTRQDSGGVAIYFDGQQIDSASWNLALLGYSPTGSDWVEISIDTSTGTGFFEWRDWNFYDDIVVIPTVSGTTALYDQYQYQGFAVYDSTLYGPQTDIYEGSEYLNIPLNLNLSCYPNPFNSQTRIRLQLSSLDPVEIGLYDLLGRKVRSIYGGIPQLYNLDFTIDLSSDKYSSGIYFIVTEQDRERRVIKSTLLK